MSFNLDSFPFVSGLSFSSSREKRSLLWLMYQASDLYGAGWEVACPQINAYAELLYAMGYNPKLTEDGKQLVDPTAPENHHVTILSELVQGYYIPTAVYGPSVGLVDGQMTLAFGSYTAPLSIITPEQKAADRSFSLFDVQCGLALGNFEVVTKEKEDKTKITYLEIVFTIPASEWMPQQEVRVRCNVKKEGGKYIQLDSTAVKRILLNPHEILAPFGDGDFAIVGDYDVNTAIQTPAMKNGIPTIKDGKQVMTAFKAVDVLKASKAVVVEVKGLCVRRPVKAEDNKPFWKIVAHLTDNRMMEVNSKVADFIQGLCIAGAGTGNEIDWLGIRDALKENLVFPFKIVITPSANGKGASSNLLPESKKEPKELPAISFGRRTTPLVAPLPTKAALPPVQPVVDVNATLKNAGLEDLEF